MVDAIQGGGASVFNSPAANPAAQAPAAAERDEGDEAVSQGRSVADDTTLSAEAVQALEESSEPQPLSGFDQSATPVGQTLDITV